MNNHLLSADKDWPEDKTLMADLSRLNAEITRYVLRYLDADAGQIEPISTHDEQTLGQRLIEMGQRIQHRAARRVAQTCDGPVIEGEVALRTLEPVRPPDVGHGQ
jgi:hypothetical protein